ncbi:unnamed protein product, partial [Urochloa humidicola]
RRTEDIFSADRGGSKASNRTAPKPADAPPHLPLQILPAAGAMPMCFLPRDSRGDLGPLDSPPLYCPPPQGGSMTMKEVKLLLANLEKEGVKINGRISSIIDDEVARIKAEAARKNKFNNELKTNGMTVLLTIASVAVGFMMGAEWCENAIRAAVAKKLCFWL